MATADEYAAWIVKNADKKGTPAFDTVAAAYKLAKEDAPAEAPQAPERSFAQQVGQQLGNVAAGAVRGAGSIGATLLYPVDKAMDLYHGDRGKNVSSLVTGVERLSRNEERRAAMDEALAGLGADTDSIAYKGGKLGAEIAGTAGVGGAVARAASAVPGVAAAAPNLLQAIRTSGMTAGPTGNALTRLVGGAVTGGTSAGLVNPEDAAGGAMIGAAAPGVIGALGATGRAVGRVVAGPTQSPEMVAAINQARQAGYVIPPTQARPTLANRALEGMSGKISTAQNASARNQTVTNDLAAEAIGLPKGTTITPDVLTSVRQAAGQTYSDIGATGVITPSAAYGTALDRIARPFQKTAQAFPNAKPSPVLDLVDSLRSQAFDASAAVEKIKQLRTAGDDAFRTGNTDIGRAARDGAAALEDAIEGHLKSIGQPELLTQFRDVRTLIAKTYSVEKALNPSTGTVDARQLAAQLKKGKPLSAGLKEAADFANRFPKAAQPIEAMGSLPQTSPLDWHAAGAMGMATANPLAMLAVGARPAARSLALSGAVQNRLVAPTANPLQALVSPQAQQLLYRSAPVTSSDR